MGLKCTTPSTALPVDLCEAKEWIGLRHDELDATVIRPLLEDASAFIEERVQIQIAPATWQLTLDKFPRGDGGVIELRRPPVRTITELAYVDANGDDQTIDAANYQLDASTHPARLLPAPGFTWPATQYGRVDAVTVTFTAGAANTAGVDRNAKRAVLLLFGSWFHNRDAVGSVGPEIETSFESALNNLRWIR